jgi:hypothetical protein
MAKKREDFRHMKLCRGLEKLVSIIYSEETLTHARLKLTAFIRNRKMSFQLALRFMLDMGKTTLHTRLNRFFANTKEGSAVTQQAFSKLRSQFDHSPFETMVRELVKEEYSGMYDLPTWHGMHVMAIDGSYLQLPRTQSLAQEYGTRGEGNGPSAGISVLFDVLHGWVLDPSIGRTDMNERERCKEHVSFLSCALPNIAEKTVLVLDRGYPSQELFEEIQCKGIKFLARCSMAFHKAVNQAPMGESVVLLKNEFQLRVYKFMLPSGDAETLVTNLFEEDADVFPELYSMRWGVETSYNELKNLLRVEEFSGKTPNSIRQDFWASMVLMNMVAIAQQEADEEVTKKQAGKENKHKYQARKSDLVVIIRDRFIFSSLSGKTPISEKEIRQLLDLLAQSVSPIRPGRSFPRNPRISLAANSQLKSTL